MHGRHNLEHPACSARMPIRQQTAMGIAWQAPAQAKLSLLCGGSSLTTLKEAYGLKLNRQRDGERIVYFSDIDIFGLHACSCERLRRSGFAAKVHQDGRGQYIDRKSVG